MKERIEQDFIQSIKNKDDVTKLTLSNVKTKITEKKKSDPKWVENENDIVNIIVNLIKQRKDSIELYKKGNREDLVNKEQNEINVLERYLPKQMTDDEIINELNIILESISFSQNNNVLIGKTLGEFNKKFKGKADFEKVKQLLNDLIIL